MEAARRWKLSERIFFTKEFVVPIWELLVSIGENNWTTLENEKPIGDSTNKTTLGVNYAIKESNTNNLWADYTIMRVQQNYFMGWEKYQSVYEQNYSWD